METTKIRTTGVNKKDVNGNSKLSADKKITPGNFRDKINEMIHNSGAAEKLKAVEK